MGCFRLLLALAVFLGHLDKFSAFTFLPGTSAVEAFFVISGFLMALSYESSYQGRPGSFYLNRFLRIYPLYYLVCFGFGGFCIVWLLKTGLALGPFAWMVGRSVLLKIRPAVILLSSQVIVLGQDSLVFLAQAKSGALVASPRAYDMDGSLSHFLFLPQTWSLGLEIAFYACVPLLAHARTKTLAVLCAMSLAAKIWAGVHAQDLGPWVGRFFPFEIGVFLLGFLACRLRISLGAWGAGPAGLVAVTVLVLCPGPALPTGLFDPFFAVLTALAIPAFLAFSRRHKMDHLAGELSYPLFLVHIPVIWIFQLIIGPEAYQRVYLWGIPIALLLSWMLVLGIDRPIARLRLRLKTASFGLDSSVRIV